MIAQKYLYFGRSGPEDTPSLSESHEGDDSGPSTSREDRSGASTSHESESSTTSPIECDIGKLQALGVNLKQLSRDAVYRLVSLIVILLLTHAHVHTYPSSSLCQFLPSWLKQQPWLHYSRFADGAVHSAEHAFYLLQTR